MSSDPIARIVAMVEDDDRESIFRVQRQVFRRMRPTYGFAKPSACRCPAAVPGAADGQRQAA
ncbi:MAG: hypothetical protein AB7S98_23760, partial [Burkholderiaceae bacterium]